ncbi:MAG: acetylornithine deacetylase, partial [Pseudomonadota bacterium]
MTATAASNATPAASDDRTERAIEILSALIGFDTISSKSNLALIEWVEDYLVQHGVASERVTDEDGEKANLIATIGSRDIPGYILSGHTDVVPVSGQPWSGDPFTARVMDGRVYGRGACDMKGYLACVLAMVPEMLAAPLARPLHILFSYDEEVGCLGVRTALKDVAAWPTRPLGCFVGEPTSSNVIVGHKAKRAYRAVAKGTTAHSSLAPSAVNAVAYAARLISHIGEMAAEFERSGARDELYDVPFTTPHVGAVHGGDVVNIVPDRCEFVFEVRAIAADDPDAAVERIQAYAREVLEPEMRSRAPGAGFEFELMSAIDGLDTAPEHDLIALTKRLAGRNGHAKVAYGTEAGFFGSMAGVPTVVIGPGSIDQAHKADEWVAISELTNCTVFLA